MTGSDMLCNLPETDGRVRSNPRLLVVGRSGKISQQLTVDSSIGKLGDDRKNCFDRLLTYDRGNICEASDLGTLSDHCLQKMTVEYIPFVERFCR